LRQRKKKSHLYTIVTKRRPQGTQKTRGDTPDIRQSWPGRGETPDLSAVGKTRKPHKKKSRKVALVGVQRGEERRFPEQVFLTLLSGREVRYAYLTKEEEATILLIECGGRTR